MDEAKEKKKKKQKKHKIDDDSPMPSPVQKAGSGDNDGKRVDRSKHDILKLQREMAQQFRDAGERSCFCDPKVAENQSKLVRRYDISLRDQVGSGRVVIRSWS